MNIELTPAAREKILDARNDNRFYKLDLTRSGCCSYAFVFHQGRAKKTDKIVVSCDETKIVVSKEAYALLKNIIIDYKKRGFRKSFQVIPNSR